MLDTLGILIGFVSVILILSLVTTSLVQASSSLLRLRGRNLGRGLAILLDAAAPAPPKADKPDEAKPEGAMNSKDLAQQIVTSPDLMNPGRSLVPDFVPAWLRSTSQSWIDRDQLTSILKNMKGLPEGLADKVHELFPQFEKVSAKRFAFFMRINSLIWAVAVAVLFQVSTPDLLRTLSTDDAVRAKLADSLTELTEYPDVAGQAFEKLQSRHADLADVEWAPEAAATSRQDLLASLRTALADNAEADSLVAEFADDLDDLYLDQLKSSVERLGELDIRPWGKGTEFYVEDGTVDWENVLGVLITALLLTLGAPFWFRALKNLSGLRDMLSPARRNDGDGQGQTGQQGA